MLGVMSWFLEVPGVRAEKRRQTAGPTVEDIRRMLAATAGDTEAETRDYAIIVTIFCLGLRVSELCGLNLEDCDLGRGTTWLKGKGRRERELVPLPALVVEAIRRYLPHRSTAWLGNYERASNFGTSFDVSRGKGPLFQTRGNRGKNSDGRLETRSVLRIVRELGQKVGLHVWCHGLRHSSITQAAELGQRAGLGLDKIRAFSRHRTIATLMIYVDEHDRTQTQRTLGDLVASTLAEP
jgi:integrase/recombinase XerC